MLVCRNDKRERERTLDRSQWAGGGRTSGESTPNPAGRRDQSASCSCARIRDVRNILVGTLRGLGVRHGDGSFIDATAHACRLLPQAPAALPRTPQRALDGGWEASQHWIVCRLAAVGFQALRVSCTEALLVLFFVSASAGGVSAAHFGGLRLLRLFFRMPMRSEPGRPEFKARRFHTPVENAIYLLGTSATRPRNFQSLLYCTGNHQGVSEKRNINIYSKLSKHLKHF